MDRRAVLRFLAFGATGVSGCLGGDGDGAATPTDGATTATSSTAAGATTTSSTGERTETTASASATTRTTTDATETTPTDRCPPSAVPDARRHVHSDYALRMVSGARDDGDENPAVAVVGEDWRSALDTDAMSDEDESFVAGTDFDRSAVLVVQYGKSSSGHDLRVTDLTTDGDAVRADLCVAGLGGPNDAPVANLFVRVPYSGSPPSRARVRIRTPTGPVTVASE